MSWLWIPTAWILVIIVIFGGGRLGAWCMDKSADWIARLFEGRLRK